MNSNTNNAQITGYYDTSSPTSGGYYTSNYWTNYPTYNGSYQTTYNGYYTSGGYASNYSSPSEYSNYSRYYYQSSGNSSVNYETTEVSGEVLSSCSSMVVNSPASTTNISSDSGNGSFISTVSNQTDTVSPTEKTCRSFSRKHQLPDRAVDIMNEWFEEHLHNPYPQLCEKEKLAEQGGITVKQVTAWFSNRRNRSQNTKPKRMKRVLEKEIGEIYQELVYNPNKQQIIEKFRHTLANHELSLLNQPN